jgi:hypothetical protein
VVTHLFFSCINSSYHVFEATKCFHIMPKLCNRVLLLVSAVKIETNIWIIFVIIPQHIAECVTLFRQSFSYNSYIIIIIIIFVIIWNVPEYKQ